MNSLGCLHCNFIFMFMLNSLYYGDAEIFFPLKRKKVVTVIPDLSHTYILKKNKNGGGRNQEENTEHLRFLVMLLTDPKFQPACTQLL